MPGQHIGKKTDHQSKWLGKDTEEFNKRHHRHRYFQPPGHIRPEDIFPISFRSKQVDGNKCKECQHHRNSDITRHIGSTRKDGNQPHDIIYKNEEERCQQVRRKLSIFRPYTTLDDIVVHHHNKHLHKADEATRSRTALRMFSIPLSNS